MDTTGSTSGLIFYALAKNPKVWNKLIEELKSFDTLKFEDLNEMKYTTAVIKETLRMYPPVSLSIPRLSL